MLSVQMKFINFYHKQCCLVTQLIYYPYQVTKETELAVNRRSNSHAEGEKVLLNLPIQGKTDFLVALVQVESKNDHSVTMSF